MTTDKEIVAVGGSFARALVNGYPEEWAKWGVDEDEEFVDDKTPQQLQDEFFEKYDHLGNEFPGNPEEDYYQGMTFTSVIRRKSDGKRFGFNYWKPIAKYGESYYEPNGDEHGFGYEQDVFVFTPVEPFTVQGFKVK